MGAHDTLHLGWVRVGHGVAARGDSRVIDEDADRSQIRVGLFGHRCTGLEVGDVGLIDLGALAPFANFVGYLFGRFRSLGVIDRNIGSCLG